MDARIIAVADVFDAITSKRSYNNPVSYEQALSIMEQEQQLYDSDVLHALHILVREKVTVKTGTSKFAGFFMHWKGTGNSLARNKRLARLYVP